MSSHIPSAPLQQPNLPPLPLLNVCFAFILLRICLHPSAASLVHIIADNVYQNFRGQHGKAYLFNAVVNISQSEATERNMTTGRHIVRDITCRQCKETVGWKYDKAYEPSEKYKEGKFILEAELLCTVY